MQLQQEKHICKFRLLRKRGLLAHTPPTFLKNCWIKKLLVACGSELKTPFLEKPPESGFISIAQFHLLRKRGLLAHTSAAFL